jgi:hypothetical protein
MDTETTQRDVALDTVAALDMYTGAFGSESTTIEKVGEGERDSVVVVLSDGSQYRLTVREITN